MKSLQVLAVVLVVALAGWVAQAVAADPVAPAPVAQSGVTWSFTTLSITITHPGSGYTAAPTVAITGPARGLAATATAGLSGTTVGSVLITYSGIGYSPSAPPTVRFSGGGGSGATATAAVITNPDGSDFATQNIGVPLPNPRFTDHGDGTVTDNLTQLIWLKNVNVPNAARNLPQALTDVVSLNATGLMNGNRAGDTSHGGTHQTDWRLPNIKELQSLIDFGHCKPALSPGYPFAGVQQANGHWSSTSFAGETPHAWFISLNEGSIGQAHTSQPHYVWAVRGGQ